MAGQTWWARARPYAAAVGYLLVLLLAWHKVDHERFLEGLRRLRPEHFALVLGVSVLHILGRALRFDRLLRNARAQHYRLSDGIRIFLIGLSASAVTPARAGDLVKAKLVEKYGIGVGVGTVLVITERLLDLLVVTTSLITMSLLLPAELHLERLQRSALALLGLLAVGMVVFTLKGVRTKLIDALLAALRGVRPFAKAGHAMGDRLGEIFRVWDEVFASPLRLAGYVAFSAAAWSIEFFKLWLVLHLLGVDVRVAVTFFVYPVSIIAGVLTLLPFSEGIVGLTGVALLVSMAGVDSGTATVAVVLDRAASTLPPLVLWALFALRTRRA